jgi:hypothetical protein
MDKPKLHVPDKWKFKPPPEEMKWREEMVDAAHDSGPVAELSVGLEISRRTTVYEWLEIARDCYEYFHGRRPELMVKEDADFLETEMRGTDWGWSGAKFCSVVAILARDKTIDHKTFETLPWADYGEEEKDTWIGRRRLLDDPDGAQFLATNGIDAIQPNPHPNCKAMSHIPNGFYFKVYDFAVACSKGSDDGQCWLSLRVTAKHCGFGSLNTVRRAVTYLCAAGWLIEIKPPEDGINGAGVYQVVEHEEWTEHHGYAFCVQLEAAEERGTR